VDVVRGRYPVPAEYGQRVRWFRTAAPGRHAERRVTAAGQGVFRLCWLGIEETWDVELDDGSTVSLYPVFGDMMEPIEPSLLIADEVPETAANVATFCQTAPEVTETMRSKTIR
jgi:hypothetical protein